MTTILQRVKIQPVQQRYLQTEKFVDTYDIKILCEQEYTFDHFKYEPCLDKYLKYGRTNGKIAEETFVDKGFTRYVEDVHYQKRNDGQLWTVGNDSNTTSDFILEDLDIKLLLLRPQDIDHYVPYSKNTWFRPILLQGIRYKCFLTFHKDYMVLDLQQTESYHKGSKTYINRHYRIIYRPTEDYIADEMFIENDECYTVGEEKKFGRIQKVKYVSGGKETIRLQISFERFHDSDRLHRIRFFCDDFENIRVTDERKEYGVREVSDFMYEVIAPISYTLYVDER